MATTNVQSFIQPIAQGSTPFLANNGNPGTVYNMPATGSYKPPMASAQNQWALNPSGGSMYATNPFWLTEPASNVGGGGGFFTVPPLTVQPPTVFPPAVTPPVTPPVSTGGGGNPGLGGSGGVGGGLNPNPNSLGGAGPWAPGTLGTGYTHGGSTFGGGTFGTVGSSVRDSISQLGAGLGFSGGNFSWQQLFDAVLPGDLYDQNTGTWNMGQVGIQTANAIGNAIGIPFLGQLYEMAGENGILGETVQNTFHEEFMRNNMPQVAESLSGILSNIDRDLAARSEALMGLRDPANIMTPNGLGWNNAGFGATGWGTGQLSPITGAAGGALGSSPFDTDGNTINDRMNYWAGTTTDGGGRDNRRGRAVNSATPGGPAGGTADTGSNASYLAQLGLQTSQQQAIDATERMFGGKYR